MQYAAARKGMNAYKQVAAQTASPAQLVLLAFEGILEYMSRAENAFSRGDLPLKAKSLLGASMIVEHLLGSLDREQGGDIAVNLETLYNFLLLHLGKANVFDDQQALKDCWPVVRNLRDAWAELARR